MNGSIGIYFQAPSQISLKELGGMYTVNDTYESSRLSLIWIDGALTHSLMSATVLKHHRPSIHIYTYVDGSSQFMIKGTIDL